MRVQDVLGLLAAPLAAPTQIDRLVDLGGARRLPLALYLPRGKAERWVVFSSGFGGSRLDYQPLAIAWREAGYAVAVVEHPGSDRRAALRLLGARLMLPRHRRAELHRRVHTRKVMLNRPADLARVMDFLQATFGVETFWVAGHSFGAYTVLASAGLPVLLPGGGVVELGDPRVTALVAMSFHPPGVLFAGEAYRRLRCPAVLLTGSRDATIDGATPQSRLEVLSRLSPAALVGVLDGADHYTFAGFGPGWRRCGPALLAVTTGYWKSLARGCGVREQPVEGWRWFRNLGDGPVPDSGGR